MTTNETLAQDTNATDAATASENQAPATKTYTQEEFDRHMAGMKNSIQKKYDKILGDLGDLDEIRTLKADAEKRQVEGQIKRGEFEKTLQELAAKKDAEIQKRDSIIKEYKVNTPLLSAAAKYNAVNAEQVKALLAQQVRLNQDGEVEVVDSKGSVRYNDAGEPLGVDDLVQDFLNQNSHFKLAAPSTTNTKSNISVGDSKKLDITKLDMKNPEHRKVYAEYRKTHGIA